MIWSEQEYWKKFTKVGKGKNEGIYLSFYLFYWKSYTWLCYNIPR